MAKAPARTPVTGANTVGSGSIAVDRHGIAIGWAIDGANRTDVRMFAPTLDAIAADGWTCEIDTVHLDRGFDYPKIRRQLTDAGLPDHVMNAAANPATPARRR